MAREIDDALTYIDKLMDQLEREQRPLLENLKDYAQRLAGHAKRITEELGPIRIDLVTAYNDAFAAFHENRARLNQLSSLKATLRALPPELGTTLGLGHDRR